MLLGKKAFALTPGRYYPSFQNFQVDLLHKLDYEELVLWINNHKLNLHHANNKHGEQDVASHQKFADRIQQSTVQWNAKRLFHILKKSADFPPLYPV